MFVWQKRAGARWLERNDSALRVAAGTQLAIIQTAGRKTALAQVAMSRRQQLEKLCARFGGTIKKLPRDWLQRTQNDKAKPIQIGKRLTILRPSTSAITSTSTRLIIPAGAAFGTGEHVTTAMSLRLLEQTSRDLVRGWSMLDLGTGSGILALAAKRFGAGKVVAIDSDSRAIATARRNARLNGINGIDFRIGDARRIPGHSFDVVTANLFSELLIELLPRLKRKRRLILSGILRLQEAKMRRALKQNGFALETIRRRGKWVAIGTQVAPVCQA